MMIFQWKPKLSGLLVLMATAVSGIGLGSAQAQSTQHLWLHYDYMVAADGRSDAPDPAAIDLVVDVFASQGIQLHIDPQHTAIPETEFVIFKGEEFGYADCGFGPPVEFSDLKAQYFHPTSNHEWHYAIFGYTGGTCASGIADLPGDDLFIALGASLPILQQFPRDRRLAWEGGTFMHELGHNLNLHHGGDDDINHKPNYLSVMNFSYQLGIPYAATPGSTVEIGLRLDYSDRVLPPLDETNLNELVGIQDTGSTDIVHFFTATSDPFFASSAFVRDSVLPTAQSTGTSTALPPTPASPLTSTATAAHPKSLPGSTIGPKSTNTSPIRSITQRKQDRRKRRTNIGVICGSRSDNGKSRRRALLA